MPTLKETLRKNFMNSVNATIDLIKQNPATPASLELADFLVDYGKEMASLLYCYEFMTEDELDGIGTKVNLVLKFVKSKKPAETKAPATSTTNAFWD